MTTVWGLLEAPTNETNLRLVRLKGLNNIYNYSFFADKLKPIRNQRPNINAMNESSGWSDNQWEERTQTETVRTERWVSANMSGRPDRLNKGKIAGEGNDFFSRGDPGGGFSPRAQGGYQRGGFLDPKPPYWPILTKIQISAYFRLKTH